LDDLFLILLLLCVLCTHLLMRKWKEISALYFTKLSQESPELR